MPRITGKEAEGLMAAYAKVHAPKEEKVAIEEPVIQKTPTEDIQERVSSIRQRLANKAQTQANLKKATAGYNFSGTRDSSGSLSSLRADPVNNNNNNTATSKGGVERTVTKDSGGGINIQKGKDLDAQTDDLIANTPTVKNSKFGSKKLEKSTLNKSTLNNVSGNPKAQDLLNRNPDTPPKKQDLLNRNPDNPPSGTPVNKLFGRGGSDGSPAPYTGGPNAAQRANAGTQKPQQQQTGTQGTQQPVKTVGGQGNRQRAVKTGGIQLGKSIRGGLRGLGNLAGRVAGGIKQGVQSAASGIKQGAQAVAGALQNKGPIQGRLSGPQRRAQQTQQKPVPQAKPAPQAQAAPQAKPVAQKLTPAQQAQKMAKDRIAAGRNTVTGELKSKPKVRKITSVMDMEGYDLIDDTVNFLISEGYVANESDALSIMSEPEFREGFDEGIQQVLNESSENNK